MICDWLLKIDLINNRRTSTEQYTRCVMEISVLLWKIDTKIGFHLINKLIKLFVLSFYYVTAIDKFKFNSQEHITNKLQLINKFNV